MVGGGVRLKDEGTGVGMRSVRGGYRVVQGLVVWEWGLRWVDDEALPLLFLEVGNYKAKLFTPVLQ